MAVLAQCLGIAHYHAVGLVELLFHFAGDFAPAGDIGRFPDESIAGGIHWKTDSRRLLDSLLIARWIAADNCHRLVISDWPTQAPTWVRRILAFKSETFWDGSPPRHKCTAASLERTQRRLERIKLAGGYIRLEVRRRVFARDGFRCLHCGSVRQLSIDHDIPISKGGTNDESNLRTLCTPCNSSKGDR